MVDVNNYGEWKRPLRLDKRVVEYVERLQLYDVWNNIPTKAWVHYQDYYHENMTSKPIKIHKRKDGTYYIQFEGFRYDIDITLGNKVQWIDWQEDQRKREKMVEKALS